MRYQAEKRRGQVLETVDTTDRYATVQEAADAGYAKWGFDLRAIRMTPGVATGETQLAVYDWQEKTYVPREEFDRVLNA